MTAIQIPTANYDRAAVHQFCEPLRSDPLGAAYLAAALFGGTLMPVRVLALHQRFMDLPAWVRAGVIDELRDTIDKQLDGVFRAAVGVAQGQDGKED
jgi:hypothetical protein